MPLPAARWRERVEFERRLVHAGGTLYVVPYLLDWLSWTGTRYLLVAGLVVVAVLELLRLVVGMNHALYRALTREYEETSVGGYALYQASLTAVVLLLSPPLAIPAMWMLTLGDPISGMLGHNAATEAKRPAVWVVMFAICVAVAVPFTVPAFGARVGVAVAATGALAATIADGIPPLVRGVAIDDNLTIPIAAAAGMWSVVALAG